MNIILITKEDFIDDSKVVLKGCRAEHVLKVLGVQNGHLLKIGMINGKIGEGNVVSINHESLELEVNSFSDEPPDPIPATLIVAMQRPKTMRKLIQSATAMGIKKFYIIESWKVEKSYWNSPLLQHEKLEEQALLGLEQAVDTILPEFIIKRRFKPFVEDELPGIIESKKSFVAHPYADNQCPAGLNCDVVIAIGPEGGFTEYEIGKMQECGMKPVSLGDRILRSEFAVTAILAKMF